MIYWEAVEEWVSWLRREHLAEAGWDFTHPCRVVEGEFWEGHCHVLLLGADCHH